MATQLDVDDLLSARVWSTLGSQAAVNTYNFRVTATTGASQTDQQFATAIELFFAALYLLILANNAVFNGVQVYRRRSDRPLTAPVQSTAATANGSGGVDAIPKNSCAILKYSTIGRGPGNRGRVFMPFVATAFMDPSGDPDVGLNTLLNGFATNLLIGVNIGTAPDTASLKWVLARFPKLPAPPTDRQIAAASSANKFGQQHKRGDYGRPNVSPI